jgi:hypothetical protein
VVEHPHDQCAMTVADRPEDEGQACVPIAMPCAKEPCTRKPICGERSAAEGWIRHGPGKVTAAAQRTVDKRRLD